MEDKEFLLILLGLADGIMKEDSSIVSPIITKINLATLTEIQNTKIKDYIKTEVYRSFGLINVALKLAVNSIDILNKKYLISMLEINEISLSDNLEANKDMIESKLTDTSITFDSELEKYNYYSILVNITINLKDADLIKIAIDKTSIIWGTEEIKLEDIQASKILQMKIECEDNIINNFYSDCLGETHLFDCDRDSQLCIQGLVAKATLLANNVPMADSTLEWKYTGESICYLWTVEQVLTLGGDLYTHLTVCKKQYENLRIYINSLNDVNVIDAITWDETITV